MHRVKVLGKHLSHRGGEDSAASEQIESQCCSGESRDPKAMFEADGVPVIGEMKNPASMRTIAKWHDGIMSGLSGGPEEYLVNILNEIFSEDVLFLAPTYHKERRDKKFVVVALIGVTKAFHNFKYTRVFLGDEGVALEFECNIGEGGPLARGIDLITLNEQGQISRFEVMARPPKAMLKLLELQSDFMQSRGLIPPRKNKK
mmetsp:Transcript_20655/g.36704  ORF Transcript_20655/g.36704 Transcript_20655/m.36704 type:complete len:202 (-) Transcript_20655:42-647(-)|eukprot:CAMPEP_0184517076 /NCGR_PEP_ID=MMETSP0198_2-20121128/5368_1 /TAXON_ID=1112570 /ORGANISM="Thraustochytrium sp., Strain LLF1b" /LENGTH=201 /DNA_ID=CAMNT_0026907437 /DNA_START=103 /DNA_END=708 /DNA_ORIENTATION=-